MKRAPTPWRSEHAPEPMSTGTGGRTQQMRSESEERRLANERKRKAKYDAKPETIARNRERSKLRRQKSKENRDGR